VGFKHWVKKLVMLSKQAGAKLLVCCTDETRVAIQRELKYNRSSVETSFKPFEDLTDFLILAKEIRDDDLIIAIAARKGTLSYNSYMDTMPQKLARHFPKNNCILIYPEQKQAEYPETGMQSHDLTLTPIQEQIDNLQKIGKAVKKIFVGGSKPAPDKEE
jgi:hypothetical protein